MEHDETTSPPLGIQQSEEIAEFAKAMAKAYGEMEQALKGADNPFFRSKYADMSDIDNVVRPALKANGLFVVQSVRGDTLATRVVHESGQWQETYTPFVPPDNAKNMAQAYGSAQTYARRYGLPQAVGLVFTDKSDDDGNAATQDAPRRQQPKKQAAPAKNEAPQEKTCTEDSKIKCSLCGVKPRKGDEIVFQRKDGEPILCHKTCYTAEEGDLPF